MSVLVNLTCPSCGSKLQITNDIDRFSCSYCGSELIVQRSGGAITIAPIVEGLREIKTGVDKTASELAIRRLEGEIADLMQQKTAVSNPPATSCFIKSVVVIFIILCGVINLLNTGSQNRDLSGVLSIIGIAIVIVAIIVYSNSKKNVKQKIVPVDQMIAEKQRELEDHRNIVRNF